VNLAPLEVQIERRWVELTMLPDGAQVRLYLLQRLRLDPKTGDPIKVWKLLDSMREGSRRVGGPEQWWDRSTTLPGLRAAVYHAAVYQTLDRMRPG
jgi:hypothetical protein